MHAKPIWIVLAILALAAAIFARYFLPTWLTARRYRGLAMDGVDRMSGTEFEHYVAALLRYRGFRTEMTPASGDLGVDIVAEIGRERYAVQCKRSSGEVPRTAVSDAVAGKQHYRCAHAVVVTNGRYRTGARELARSTGCLLIDRDGLAEWIHDFREGRAVRRVL
ncbi:MAG: restriction endonuclease [Armatimonadota bacterium]